VLITAVALLAACSLEGDNRPNVLLITIDTIRADHCSSYGYHRLTTPTLSRVADQGVVFREAYAPIPTTAPSHASIFTSMYPRSHKLMKNGLTLQPQLSTLAEILKAAGFTTGAVVGSFPVAARFGFNQGFDFFDDAFDEDGGQPRRQVWEGNRIETVFDRDAKFTSRRAAEWLRNQRSSESPFFLWVHYFDPHSPYEPGDEYRDLFWGARDGHPADHPLEHTVAMYDAEIRETDDAIGNLLSVVDEESLMESTVVVITGDHGEGLMQHGHMAHGIHLYEEAVRVPLVFSWPKVLPAGRTLQGPVQLIDVMPTLLELTGIPRDDGNDRGMSLVGAMKGRDELDPDREIFLERRLFKNRRVGQFFVNGTKFGLRSGPWKYIEAVEESTRELYNLETDPHETINLATEHQQIAGRLSKKLGAWSRTHPTYVVPPESDLSAEDLEMLRVMGYVQ
jgi:arylsulfatase A-like enzyme